MQSQLTELASFLQETGASASHAAVTGLIQGILVRWVSGWNQQFAKLPYVITRTGGSNPPLTARNHSCRSMTGGCFLFLLSRACSCTAKTKTAKCAKHTQLWFLARAPAVAARDVGAKRRNPMNLPVTWTACALLWNLMPLLARFNGKTVKISYDFLTELHFGSIRLKSAIFFKPFLMNVPAQCKMDLTTNFSHGPRESRGKLPQNWQLVNFCRETAHGMTNQQVESAGMESILIAGIRARMSFLLFSINVQTWCKYGHQYAEDESLFYWRCR